MNILSRELSQKTSKLVSDIISSVSLPVQFHPLANRPNPNDQVAGSVDAYGYNGQYQIWINVDFPQDIFEANLLHELRHIVQTESGFSGVFNKQIDRYPESDQTFIKEVGSHLSSVVLDIDVNKWLESQGYSFSFFYEHNADSLIANSSYPYNHLDDPLNFANLSLAILHASLYVNDDKVTELFNAYSCYSKVIETVSSLRKKLLSMNINDPIMSLIAHGLEIQTLGLWKYYVAATPRSKIRTSREFFSFADLHCFSVDTEE